MATMEAREVIALFNRLENAVQSKVPVWLALMEMTGEEVAGFERFLAKCDEKRGVSEGIWRNPDCEQQGMLCELMTEAHRGR